MQAMKEYTILPQLDRDKDCGGLPFKSPRRRSKNCCSCLSLFVSLVLLVLISGGVLLAIGLYFPEIIPNGYNDYNFLSSTNQVKSHHDGTDGSSLSLEKGIEAQPPPTGTTSGSDDSSKSSPGNGTQTTATGNLRNTTEVTPPETPEETSRGDEGENTGEVTSGSDEGLTEDEGNPEAEAPEEVDDDEEDDNTETSKTKDEGEVTEPKEPTDEKVKVKGTNSSSSDQQKAGGGGPLKELMEKAHNVHIGTQEEVAQFIRLIEAQLQNATGIPAELIVPLFMLLCFLGSLSIVTCCCYCMMRRRDISRRKLLGKIITDLQTGDSKSILLDQDQDD